MILDWIGGRFGRKTLSFVVRYVDLNIQLQNVSFCKFLAFHKSKTDKQTTTAMEIRIIRRIWDTGVAVWGTAN